MVCPGAAASTAAWIESPGPTTVFASRAYAGAAAAVSARAARGMTRCRAECAMQVLLSAPIGPARSDRTRSVGYGEVLVSEARPPVLPLPRPVGGRYRARA